MERDRSPPGPAFSRSAFNFRPVQELAPRNRLEQGVLGRLAKLSVLLQQEGAPQAIRSCWLWLSSDTGGLAQLIPHQQIINT